MVSIMSFLSDQENLNSQDSEFEAKERECYRSIVKLLAFYLEGSNLNLFKLTNLAKNHFIEKFMPEQADLIRHDKLEQAIQIVLTRKAYGIKNKKQIL